MVLVGNKCDLQAWAVDMTQARDVSVCKLFPAVHISNKTFPLGGKAVRCAVRWNLRQDPNGCRRCILHAGAWDPQRQRAREEEQKQARNWWQPEPTIPLWAAVKKRPHKHTLIRHAHTYTHTSWAGAVPETPGRWVQSFYSFLSLLSSPATTFY